MKKLLVLILFFLTGISVFAQNFREARIFIPPIAGAANFGDNAYFYKQLAYEVSLQYHSIVRTQSGSDYVLRGKLGPFDGGPVERRSVQSPVPEGIDPPIDNAYGRREFFSWEIDGGVYFYDATGGNDYEPSGSESDGETDSEEYVFALELVNSGTGEVISKQSIIYNDVDSSIDNLVAVVVYNILSGVPDVIDDIRDRWLFLGISAFWDPRIYENEQQSINMQNFGVRLSSDLHFLDFMSINLGMQLVRDNIVISGGENYKDMMLEFPISLSFSLKPFEHFMLEPFGGVSLNFSLTNTTQPSFLSWFFGLQVGAIAGPGMIVFAPQFSMDFSVSKIDGKAEYRRYMLQIGIGYKIGLFPRKVETLSY